VEFFNYIFSIIQHLNKETIVQKTILVLFIIRSITLAFGKGNWFVKDGVMRFVTFLIVNIFLLFTSSYSQELLPSRDYVKGEVLLTTHQNVFDFPLEVYGAYISIVGNRVFIDSVIYSEFKENTRVIKNETIIPFPQFKKEDRRVAKKNHLKLNKELLNAFKTYGVYYIERCYKAFSPDDTLKQYSRRDLYNQRYKHLFPNHYDSTIDHSRKVFGDTDKILKTENANKELSIKFNPKFDVLKVVDQLKKLKSVKYVIQNAIVKFYGTSQNIPPNDAAYYHPDMMDFENAWEISIGENGDPLITTAVIDGNFANCATLSNLKINLNGNGHDTKVASVASGTYIYELKAGNKRLLKKMIFAK
jgi:hypothetical protein